MEKTNFAISESAIEAMTKAMSEALAKMASVEMTEFLTKPTMWAISDPVIELLTKELSDSVTKVMMEIAVPEWLTKAMIGNISSALSMLVVNNPAILAELIKSNDNLLKLLAIWIASVSSVNPFAELIKSHENMLKELVKSLNIGVVSNPAILAELIKSHENQLKDLVELLGIRIAYILANQD